MITAAAVTAVTGMFSELIGLGAELIEDKDKKNEYIFRTQEMANDLLNTLLSTATVPWVDATVKILITLKAFIRPIGGAIMTAFGMYAHIKGVEMDTAAHLIFDGALPAWGLSRHSEKKKKIEAKEKAQPMSWGWDDE